MMQTGPDLTRETAKSKVRSRLAKVHVRVLMHALGEILNTAVFA